MTQWRVIMQALAWQNAVTSSCTSNCNWGTCIAPPTRRPRAHITESICILVPIDRMKQKCFQITTKQVQRSQQFQLRQ